MIFENKKKTRKHGKSEDLKDQAIQLGQTAGKSRKPMRRGVRIALIASGTVFVLLLVAGGVAFAAANSWFNKIERVSIAVDPKLKRPAATAEIKGELAPVNILLLGSDSSEATNASSITGGELTGYRSDTIMVAQLSADRTNVTFMSIMRDNWVNIQGVGESKINAAFSYGGLPLAVNTVENFIGARIDYVAIVDFESFKGLTDAVGGVTVNNTEAFVSSGTGESFSAGEVRLSTGEQALTFVRERYVFSDGDYQRVKNQQAYMKGLVQSILSRDTLGNPQRVLATADALQPFLILSDNLDLARSVELGSELGSLRSDGISFFTSPTLGTGTSSDGQSIVIVDEASMIMVREKFANGTINEYTLAPSE